MQIAVMSWLFIAFDNCFTISILIEKPNENY